ncbi:hypothetical protein PMAYCL1PPCAC_24528, partial [Pristionchus mayeri]
HECLLILSDRMMIRFEVRVKCAIRCQFHHHLPEVRGSSETQCSYHKVVLVADHNASLPCGCPILSLVQILELGLFDNDPDISSRSPCLPHASVD